MATIAVPAQESFSAEIERLGYNYRTSEFNKRYYSTLLDKTKRKNLWAQLTITLLTGLATAMFRVSPAFSEYAVAFGRAATVLSALAFATSVIAPIFGWSRAIDDFTARITAWHYASRQIESALKILLHSAASRAEANLAVQFADEAFKAADNMPDTAKQNMKLSEKVRLEVEKAFPVGYERRAL